jgi:hypothetical protein
MPKKKTAAKKRTAKKAAPTKAAFVREQPRDMSAKDVVAKAAGVGLKLTDGYVYTIRTLANARAKKAPAATKAGKAPSAKARGKAPDKKNRVLEQKRQHPDWTAEQIAKAAGCSANYVYLVSRAKPGRSVNGTTVKSQAAQHLDHVRALRGVILHVGIDRAKEMMDQIVKDLMVLG